MWEYEVEAEITYQFIRSGASGHAYMPIIATGANACALHYVTNHSECKSGDLLLLDFGAEYGNYAADCSRTIPVDGHFSNRQKDLYKAVYSVFTMARDLLKPGITIKSFNDEVNKMWEEEHLRLGLYNKKDLKNQEPREPLRAKYYPHGTAHFIGLDVHDVGFKHTELAPGMVLTCEPGIYIDSEGIGIRLENDILITADGNEDLMKTIPMNIEEIEEGMKR
jgi:Xaa-Pro aminopeptidase